MVDMYIDAHSHLNDSAFDETWGQIAQSFVDAGGVGIVTVGCDMVSSKKACNVSYELRQKYNIYAGATIGIHPSEICFGGITKENQEILIGQWKQLYDQHKNSIYAIGECGIDLHYTGVDSNILLQQEIFALQVQFAQEKKLPVVIHSRDGFQETIEVMRKYPDATYYMHCFGYSVDELSVLLEEFPDIMIGFDCNISYPKATPLRDALKMTPLENVLLETDAPYLSPQTMRGQTNTPNNVIWLYDYVSGLLGVGMEKLQQSVFMNFKKFYGIE